MDILLFLTVSGLFTSVLCEVNKTKQVCYEHVGCFSNAPPFDNADLVLPKSPSDVGTQFLLFTREGPSGNVTNNITYTNTTDLENSYFSTSRPTKFIIHGFSNNIKTEWIYVMKDELLKKEDCNVMIVVWGPGAKFPDYLAAVANTRVVAEQVKQMIMNMVSMGITYQSLHLIGHSLGAHTSGHVGQLLRKENLHLGRITGLDPAEPDYKDHPKVVRLDKLDAIYVDVIHTNGAPFSKGGAGMFEPCGDVDFYVNGGENQPDCPDQISGALSHLGDLLSGKVDALATVVSCSHSRAHEVFTESINSNNCQFTSYPCDGYDKFQNGQCLSCGEQGCGVMGYDSDYYFATGMLFMNTRMKAPFCGHHYGVRLHVSEQTDNTKGKVVIQLNGTWGVSEWLTITRCRQRNNVSN
ncbi:inactive pancreatic lipase-related protein 1-like [Ruditapes philippinarum]|uniref:inactive pancreatic lipase-related protein 1-like n=1 Tax=Ruditapes philippinarum TaxID=129788 RepID=UPI00295B5AE2|nr:inactive pancreatic lipase-related protein 1-like [Ruditapes philippinarum]